MNDREMLELAAKAYGIQKLDWYSGSQCFYYDDEETGRECWNPLEDEGQALRLAAKRKIGITWLYDRVLARSDLHTFHYELLNGDNKAALCRAITRAGASIGEKMGRAE